MMLSFISDLSFRFVNPLVNKINAAKLNERVAKYSSLFCLFEHIGDRWAEVFYRNR